MKKLTLLFALLCASVMGWATPVTYTGAGFSGTINSYNYDIAYSITYDDDHHLTFNVTLDGTFKETTGFVFEVWSPDLSTGNFKSLVHAEGNSWSVTDTKDYQSMEGQALASLRFRLASQAGGTDQIYMSDYRVGLSGTATVEGPTSRATAPTAPIENVKAITSWYYCKSCNFADWGGSTSCQNTRFGKKISCNRSGGDGWMGFVEFGDLDCSGMEKMHMDIWVENDATMRLFPIHYAYGHEYSHSVSLTGGQWNSIELNLNSTDFDGAPDDFWNVINQFKIDQLAEGLTFWVDNLYFYSDQSPVFTSISVSGPSTCQVGNSTSLSIETLDQFAHHIDAEYTCSVSPASAGTVVGTTYTAAAEGIATITVTSGLISNSITLYNNVGTNLALNKTSEAGYNPGNQGEINTKANDGDETTRWVTWQNRPASEEWWYVDLGNTYDISCIIVSWGVDYSTNYILQVRDNAPSSAEEKANDDAWTTIATVTTASANSSVFSSVTGTGRYVRIHSLSRSSVDCIRLSELRVYGTEHASATKAVSASVNDDVMGTATVKQLGVDVTEVATGSEVTFSAVANDGYIFVEWSNGEKNATFNATVNSTMNLTANFRALGNIYCNTAVTSTRDDDVHTAYATLKRTSANNYALIVRSAETLGNFTNTELVINGTVTNLNNHGTLSNENHVLTYEFTSTTAPSMNTPYLYVNVPGSKFTECWFTKLTNIEYDVPCDDDVATTAVALSQTSANLLMGATMTLTPSYTPVYTSDKALTWTTSDPAIATVDGGVVTPVAPGTVTITAKLTSDNSISSTCEVTVVDALLPATWYGYSVIKPQEGVTGYTYTITRNADQTLTFTMTTDKNIVGYVSGIAGDVTGSFAGYTSGTHSGSFTTTATYTDNTLLNLRLTFASALYAAPDLHIAYYVGSSNTALPQAVAVNETKDNEAILDAYDGQNVIGIVGRSFTAGSLYTLVMPFDVDAAQTAAKLPGSLTTLNNTIVKENGDLRVNFVNASTIEAGVPYLYVPSVNVENPVFEGVSLDKDLQPTEPADGYAKYYGIYAPTTGSVLKTIANAYVLGSDQYLYDVQDLLDEQSMKALRGYFVLNFPSTSSNPAPKPRAKIVFNSNETQTTTGIGEVEEENVQCTKFMENGILYIVRDGKMYNAQGQLMK